MSSILVLNDGQNPRISSFGFELLVYVKVDPVQDQIGVD